MTETNGATSRLIPTSLIPGRARWEVRGLRGHPQIAERLSEALIAHGPIRLVSANAVSGRVLVEYDAVCPLDALVAAINQIIAPLFPAAAPRRAPPRASGAANALDRLGVATGRRVMRWAVAAEDDPTAADQDLVLFAGLIGPHAGQLGRALAGSFAANVLGLLRILPIGVAMNALAHGTSLTVLGFGLGIPGTVAAMATAAVGLTLLRGWLRHRSQLSWTRVARDFQHDLRMLAWDQTQRLDMALLDDRRHNTALTILGEDINQCEQGLDAAYGLLDLGFNTLLFSGALLAYSLTLGGVAVLPIPALIVLSITLHPKVKAHFAKVAAERTRLAGTLEDGVSGIATARSFTGEADERDRIAAASNHYRAASQASVDAAVTLPLSLETTILVGQVAIYLLNSYRVSMGQTIGELSVINTATGHLLFPLTSLGPLIENMQRGLSAFDRVRRFIVDSPVENESGAPLATSAVAGQIDYRDIDFAYPSGQPVFERLSLSIQPGAWTGVVGHTGSGKSSLIKLLLRFYQPQGGEIALDGRNIQSLRVDDLRRAISVVSQDIYLFQRSIFDNLAIGRPDASREEVIAAAQAAQAHAFITRLPNGYDTVLGEGGQGLSGGERQRIAIARALLKDAPILVFDEAMSSLDSDTEMDVQAALRRLFAGRTVIAIAHRLSTVRHADCIFVLEDGQVVQQGTHAGLVRQRGRYRALWNSQLGLGEERPARPEKK